MAPRATTRSKIIRRSGRAGTVAVVHSGESAAPSRRQVLRAVLPMAGVVGLAACGGSQRPPSTVDPAPPQAGATPAAPPATPAPAGPATEVDRATSGRPEVALTFHGAGDLDLARAVLTALADRGAAATVLAVGTWLASAPDAARLVTDLGHELGNHTWSHPDLTGLDEATLRAEIERCRDRIVTSTGGPGAFFRPSQARHATPEVRRIAAAAGYSTVLSYAVDSGDASDPGPAAVRHNVAATRAGSVVSMHLGHPGTLHALPAILDDLTARGLRPVTARQLFG